MSNRPEALRLADALATVSYTCDDTVKAAAELRRLHAQAAQDEALLRQALYALEYASDMTKPEGLQGCECPICTNIAALRERLGDEK